MKYSGEGGWRVKGGERGNFSSSSMQAESFRDASQLFFSANHKSCSRLSKGTCLYDGNFHTCLYWCPALYCFIAVFKTLQIIEFLQKEGVFFVSEKEIHPSFAKLKNTTSRVNSPPDFCSYREVIVLHSPKTL